MSTHTKMSSASQRSFRLREFLSCAAAAGLLAASLAVPEAQAQSGSSSHRVSARSASAGSAQKLDLSIGKSLIIELPRDANRAGESPLGQSEGCDMNSVSDCLLCVP